LRRKLKLPLTLANPSTDARGRLITPKSLDFSLSPTKNPQSRFNGRLGAVPALDLSAYRVRACIDWVQIEITTTQTTQGVHISRWLNSILGNQPYVTDLNGKVRSTGRGFLVRVQNPELTKIREGLRDLHSRCGLVGPVKIDGIEVSIDFFSNDGTDQKRWQMVGALGRLILPAPDSLNEGMDRGRYVYSVDGMTKTVKIINLQKLGRIVNGVVVPFELDVQNHKSPTADSTVYFGEKNSDVMISIQNKITDRRDPSKNTVVNLDQNHKRARIEVTLRSAALTGLGLRFIDDLGGFDFGKLRSDIFRFWLPTFESGLAEPDPRIAVFEKSGMYGLERYDIAYEERFPEHARKREGDTRKRVAHAALNERARAALRRLKA
jgi:hypothetical protein